MCKFVLNWWYYLENRDFGEKSRVNGDIQARFCERFWVEFLLPTRHKKRKKHRTPSRIR